MKSRMLSGVLAGAALLLGTGAARAADRSVPAGPRTDSEIASLLTHEIRMYPRYSIWDDLAVRVNNGAVQLLGAVNQPYKKSDLERLARGVPGVEGVTNEIRVLPLSPFDDRLRIQVARAIYRDSSLSRYAIQAVPPIHIIVENGHVTLKGVVNNDLEKQIAGLRAATAGMSLGAVTNDLEVEHPSVKKG